MPSRLVVPCVVALAVLAGCSDDAPERSGDAPSVSIPSRSAAPSPEPSVAATPVRLPQVDHDVFGRSGSGTATFAVTLDRPVELMFACTGGGSEATLSTEPSVTGVTGPCDEDPASLTAEILRLSTYPQRIVFTVRTQDPVRWRLGLDSELIPTG